ncbi:MAG TPA: exonuclease SbcCD subunit D [Longilinea sp.]|nr:exonuclease SbcCD subunit D [Longilinea sp.]
MARILHFADAHIDMVSQGRQDPQTGLPLRALDFLKALDTIIQTAIDEKVDLVLFAGDTYRDRAPAPTFQREWGRRMVRLSQAGIPTLLLVGNHDRSPAFGRAHALQEYETLQIPHVLVAAKPCLIRPEEIGAPLQIIALPWLSRSGMVAALGLETAKVKDINEAMEKALMELVQGFLQEIDPTLPVVLTAHAMVQGARLGAERSLILGNELVLPPSMVKDPRLDYVALGDIHKAQNLNGEQSFKVDPKANRSNHPPVIYPGSIERVDFGEADDDKYFVIVDVQHGSAQVSWRKLAGRAFIDCACNLTDHKGTMDAAAVQAAIMAVLPPAEKIAGAMLRLVVTYPRELETLIDETAIRHYAEPAFEFHFLRHPQIEARFRLPEGRVLASASPLELLEMYWDTMKTSPEEKQALQSLAAEVIAGETKESDLI